MHNKLVSAKPTPPLSNCSCPLGRHRLPLQPESFQLDVLIVLRDVFERCASVLDVLVADIILSSPQILLVFDWVQDDGVRVVHLELKDQLDTALVRWILEG